MPVTLAFTLTNARAQEVAQVVGEMLQLKDANNVDRSATQQEVEDWLWKIAKSHINNWRKQKVQNSVVDPPDIGDASLS